MVGKRPNLGKLCFLISEVKMMLTLQGCCKEAIPDAPVPEPPGLNKAADCGFILSTRVWLFNPHCWRPDAMQSGLPALW